jgi:hypothetical protein
LTGQKVEPEPTEALVEPVEMAEPETEVEPEPQAVVVTEEAAVPVAVEPEIEVEVKSKMVTEEAETAPVEVEPVAALEPELLALEGVPDTIEEWVEVEDEDELDEGSKDKGKKKGRQKKRRLVYDERLGQVVTERRRKPSRRSWLNTDDE